MCSVVMFERSALQVRARATFPQLSVCQGRAHAERSPVSNPGDQPGTVPQSGRLGQDRLLRLRQLPALSGRSHQEGQDLHMGRVQADEGLH